MRIQDPKRILKMVLDDLRRFCMCLNCPLDPEECGRTNRIMRNGNCVKIERKE